MDAFLGREAYRTLEALALLSPQPGCEGFLVGHKRGQRYIIEKIIPLPRGLSRALENFYFLDKLFQGKILGFFGTSSSEKKLKRILKPFGYRKIFLDIQLDRKKKLAFRASLIDYKKNYFLSPIKIKLPKRGKNERAFKP